MRQNQPVKLINKDEALRHFERRLDETIRGTGGSLLFVGPTGTGKRYLLEIARQCARAQRTRCHLPVLQTCGQGQNPYLPFAKLAGYQYTEDRGLMPKRWHDHFGSQAVGQFLSWLVAAAALPGSPALVPVVGGVFAGLCLSKVIPELRRAEGKMPCVSVLADILVASARKRPVVAFLDDAHFGGAIAVEILREVHHKASSHPFLLVASWDEQIIPPPEDVPVCFLSASQESGMTREEARRKLQQISRANRDLCPLIRSLSLLDGPIASELVQQDALRDAVNLSCQQVDAALRSWRSMGLIAGEGDGRFSLKSVVRECLYDTMAKDERDAYHKAWAEALIALDEKSQDSYAVQIADHFMSAGCREEEVKWRKEAAQRASTSYLDFGQVSEQTRLALQAWQAVPKERRDLKNEVGMLLDQANALTHLGNLPEARQVIGQVEQKVGRCRDANLRAEVNARSGWLRVLMGDVNEGVARMERARKAFISENDHPNVARMNLRIGTACSDAGETAKAEAALTSNLRLPEETLDSDLLAATHLELGHLYTREGHRTKDLLVGARMNLEAAERLFGEDAGVLEQARLYCYYARLHGWEDAPEALEHAQKALELCQGFDLHLEGEVHNVFVEVLSRQGKWKEAKEHYQRSVEIFEKIGSQRELAKAHSTWARLHHRLWNFDEALLAYRQNIEVTKRTIPVAWHHVTQNLNLMADLQRWSGDLTGAKASLKESEKVLLEVPDEKRRIVCSASLQLCCVEWLLAHEPLTQRVLQEARERAAQAEELVPYYKTIMYQRRSYCRLDRLAGNLTRAEKRLRELLESAKEGRQETETYELALDAWELALVFQVTCDEPEARRWFFQAWEWAEAMGNSELARRIAAT